MEQFPRHRAKRDGHASACKSCTQKKWREHYRNQPSSVVPKEHRATAKAERPITVRELEWAGGFLEGEGSFTKIKSGGSVDVKASQLNEEPLLKLRGMFGGSIREYRTSKDKRVYQWGVHGPRARGVMMTVYGFMSARRRQQIKATLAA